MRAGCRRIGRRRVSSHRDKMNGEGMSKDPIRTGIGIAAAVVATSLAGTAAQASTVEPFAQWNYNAHGPAGIYPHYVVDSYVRTKTGYENLIFHLKSTNESSGYLCFYVTYADGSPRAGTP